MPILVSLAKLLSHLIVVKTIGQLVIIIFTAIAAAAATIILQNTKDNQSGNGTQQ